MGKQTNSASDVAESGIRKWVSEKAALVLLPYVLQGLWAALEPTFTAAKAAPDRLTQIGIFVFAPFKVVLAKVIFADINLFISVSDLTRILLSPELGVNIGLADKFTIVLNILLSFFSILLVAFIGLSFLGLRMFNFSGLDAWMHNMPKGMSTMVAGLLLLVGWMGFFGASQYGMGISTYYPLKGVVMLFRLVWTYFMGGIDIPLISMLTLDDLSGLSNVALTNATSALVNATIK